jgi:hypothetical protein
VKAFVGRGFHVVANSLKVTQSTEVAASDRVALVAGDIGDPVTAAKIVEMRQRRLARTCPPFRRATSCS